MFTAVWTICPLGCLRTYPCYLVTRVSLCRHISIYLIRKDSSSHQQEDIPCCQSGSNLYWPFCARYSIKSNSSGVGRLTHPLFSIRHLSLTFTYQNIRFNIFIYISAEHSSEILQHPIRSKALLIINKLSILKSLVEEFCRGLVSRNQFILREHISPHLHHFL